MRSPTTSGCGDGQSRCRARMLECLANRTIGGERMIRNLRRLLIGAAVAVGLLAATAAPAAAGLASTNHTEPGRQPPDSAMLGAAHNALGIVFKDTGRYPAAAREYDIALGLSGPATDLAAAVYHNLAGLAYAESRFVEAEIWARRGLALRERT